jgi:acetolactate synthase I/II/III large subunit
LNRMVEVPQSPLEKTTPAAIQVRSGGRILAEALRTQGVDRVFCVPGESYLDLLDALYDMPEIQIIVAKHEGAAANMAEADGKLTGRPGICMVTRGPGATHASVGAHTAFQDSTPMILLIGQVARSVRGREAFQEVEFRQMFAPLAKWVAEIEDPARIPEYMLRAFECATSGRPGPVVLSLPEDVLAASVAIADARPTRAARLAPGAAIDAIRAELSRAERPLVIAGGSGWSDEACADLASFVDENALPVAASFRRQDLLDNLHPSYIGHLTLGTAPYLAKRVKAADLIIALGCRLGDVTTGSYSLIPVPRASQRLVHIHAGAEELNRVHQADLAIHAAPREFAAALKECKPLANLPWRNWTREGHQEFLEYTTPPGTSRSTTVDFAQVVSYLSHVLPEDAIICNGAGNYTVWVHRFFRYKQRATELAPVSGSMGYGIPASIAAKLRYPHRTVVSFAGDGCFLMYAQELATACQFGAAIIVIVVNNGMYGTIRMHQERRFPGRVSATGLANPDFIALARAYGAHAERVDTTDAFAAAFENARQSGRPALIELCVDPNQITPDRRLV